MAGWFRRRARAHADEPAQLPLIDDAEPGPGFDPGPIRTSFREYYRAHHERQDDAGSVISEPQRREVSQLAIEDNIQQLLAIDGASGAAIIDYTSGMALAQGGSPGFDLSIAAAGNSNVVRAKLATMNDIGLAGKIDDILITLDSQYHLINVLSGAATQGLFVYLVLDRTRANLALARHKLSQISKDISI